MADNNFVFSTSIDLNKQITYGSKVVYSGIAFPQAFTPTHGITALNLGSLSISGNKVIPSFTLGMAGVTLPFEFTYDGTTVSPSSVGFYVTADNTAIHGSTLFTDVILTASAYGTSLSAGVTGTMSSGSWTTVVDTITALGDTGAPSGVSGFTVNLQDRKLQLSWTNSTESDVVGTRVKRSTTAVPANSGVGTTVYTGTGTSYSDTGAKNSELTYYYAAFSYDNAGKYATLTAGATGSGSPNYGNQSSLTEHVRLYEQGQI